MRKKNVFKRIAVIMAIAAISVVSAIPSSADAMTDSGTSTANGSVNISGTFLPLTIAITHQISVSYVINPNTGTITANPITVTNDTKVPINVTVQSLSSASGGDLTFTDVGPNDKEWNSLSCTDTKKYIALGLKISDASGWNNGHYADTDWAASKTSALFGSLASGATGNIALTAKTGLAFDDTYTAKANVVLMINLV